MYGITADAAVRVLRERLGLQGYPQDNDVWRLLELLEEAGEVRSAVDDIPAPCVIRGRGGVPVIYLTTRKPRRAQVRAIFEEVAHCVLCAPGLACLPPAGAHEYRFFLAANDRDEREAEALWLAWLLPWDLLMRDFHEGTILDASGCAPADLNERMEMFLR